MMRGLAGVSSTDRQTFSIGQLAQEFEVTHRTIRFYEDEGLLTPARRGTTRIYSTTDRGRLALILRGKRLGFSIAEIKEFLDLYEVDEDQVEQMKFALQRAQDRLLLLDQQLADLKQTKSELQQIEAAIRQHLENTDADEGKSDSG
ncbi:MAG: MerR family DNA-binding transcriptional regulator [Alphaproteobacteria bacterium]|nr:MerR family DNA-binding transcriptional regulator [Alphaproteobacteria bacterium SS10]